MNSIERVRAAIHFQRPDRVPVYRVGLGDVLPMTMIPSKHWQPGHAADEEGLFPFHCDDMWVKLHLWNWQRPGWAKAPQYRNWLGIERREVDEFGCIWEREANNASLGHPGRPVLTDWDDLECYLQRYNPEADDRSRYAPFIALSKLVGRQRYRMCILGFQGPFTMAHAIRGFTDFLPDHRSNPEEVKRLLQHLTDFYLKVQDCWVKYGAKPHGFMLYDDLGDQSRPLVSPSMFKEFYAPVYKRLIANAHAHGCEMHLHSCGKIDKLIPTLIEWGLDALQLDSPRMIGYHDLAPFRGKIMFWGDIDIQRIYPLASPEECEREVWHMIRNLGTPAGGYGAYLYPQTYHIGVPAANVRAFKRGVKQYSRYGRIPERWWQAPLPESWDGVPPLPE